MLRVIRLQQLIYPVLTPSSRQSRLYNYVWPRSYNGDMESEIQEGQSTPTAPQPQERPPRKKRDTLEPQEIRTSKTLSYILRHGSKKEGLKMRPDGYVRVDELVRFSLPS